MLDFIFSLIWYYAAYRVFRHIYNFFFLIYRHYIRTPYDLQKRYGKGSWVLVTGATDGIGKGLALGFAKLGFNLILVSRTLSKLKEVGEELKKEAKSSGYDIQTDVIEFDFTKRTSMEDYKESFDEVIKKRDISVLINNIGYTKIITVAKADGEFLQDMINTNVVPQAALSSMLLNKLLSRKDKSAIINLASFASMAQVKGFVPYCAGKTFNNMHSKVMHYETEGKIDIMSVKPMYVATPLSQKKANGIDVITVEKLTKTVLSQLGYDIETFGSINHEIQARILLGTPQFLLNFAKIRKNWYDPVI